ncbi:MAG: hypothetical protein IPG07_03710 [Crocinitomicaceae bacterium]|nr:hypothetical protein [Crocinitomicaceae bacterium]
MKKTLFLYFAIVCSTSFAGGFMFPNVEYDYAKVYLFNANEKAETDKPEFSVYMNDVYAKSKIGNGFNFSEQMNAQLNSVFRLGVDGSRIIWLLHSAGTELFISIMLENQLHPFHSVLSVSEFNSGAQKNCPNLERNILKRTFQRLKNNLQIWRHCL